MLFPMFESYDTSSEKQITLENFNDMFGRLLKDEVMLGKVPDITADQASELFTIFADKPSEESEEAKLTRMSFEEICFEMNWKRIEKQEIDELINKLYK